MLSPISLKPIGRCLAIIALVWGIAPIAGCSLKNEVHLSGRTMGTTFNVKVVAGYLSRFSNLRGLSGKINQRLEAINRSMSIYLPDSEISKFNAHLKTETAMAVSADFFKVLSLARRLHTITNGAWDGTVMPLVNRWGFGSAERTPDLPDELEIRKLRSSVGFQHITLKGTHSIKKENASISLDLASIAKGYAVDQISEIIKQDGFDNYLVEIGGEVYASGLRKDGKPWRLGINRPEKNASPAQVYKVLSLKDQALATSGDYRNFFEADGKRYSHVIDPRTGYPVANGVVSVSIVADSCAFADGLATAVMVLGVKKGMEIVQTLDGVECLIIVRDDAGGLIDHYSPGLQPEPPGDKAP